MAVLSREYALAARAAGRGPIAIAVDHVLPNIAPALIVQATIQFADRHSGRGGALLSRPRRAAAAGVVGADARRTRRTCSTTRRGSRSIPGVAIALSVLGLNLLGDGLRDALDPKLKAPVADMLLEVADLAVDLRDAGRRLSAHRRRTSAFASTRARASASSANSGSGKTMTALALMGSAPEGARVAGSIRFEGRELVGLERRGDAAACAATGSP